MDFDHLLARVIDIYKTIKEKIEAHVHDIFHAADVNIK